MQPFEYLSVLISIVMGLALANLLAGFARLMHARDRVVMYWPALVWAVLLFVILVQHWWAEFALRDVRTWDFAGFVSVLMIPVVLFLLCDLVLPHRTDEGSIDLNRWYFDNRRWFFSLLIALPILSFIEEYATRNAMLKRPVDSAILIVFALLGIGGLLNRSRRFHEVLVIAAALLFGAYIVILFSALQ